MLLLGSDGCDASRPARPTLLRTCGDMNIPWMYVVGVRVSTIYYDYDTDVCIKVAWTMCSLGSLSR